MERRELSRLDAVGYRTDQEVPEGGKKGGGWAVIGGLEWEAAQGLLY